MKMIVATDLDGGIGFRNDLPWPRIKCDMAWFREKTLLKTVVMGKNTWDSLGGKPLPKRRNVIISSSMTEDDIREAAVHGEVYLYNDLESFLSAFKDHLDQVVVIGGKTLYEQLAEHCDEILHTVIVGGHYPTDTKIDINQLIGDRNDWIRDLEKCLIEYVDGRRLTLDFISYKRLPAFKPYEWTVTVEARPCTLGEFKQLYPNTALNLSHSNPNETEGMVICHGRGTPAELYIWKTKEEFDLSSKEIPVTVVDEFDPTWQVTV